MSKLSNKKILVLGFARSGYSTAKVLKKLNYDVIVNAKEDLSNNEQARELVHLGIEVISGDHPLTLLEDIDLIVKNPGIPYSIPFLQEAIKREIKIVTEIELTSELFENDIVAITGTNGKTTTTQLTYNILKEAKKDVKLAGNIGFPSIEVAYENKNSLIIMEVSSFQLQGTYNFKPSICAITNLGIGHLDYHGSIENYRNSKKNIFKNQTNVDILILNIEEQEKYDLTKIKSQVIFYDTKDNDNAQVVVRNNEVIFKNEVLFSVEYLKLPGKHNLENAINAALIAHFKGAKREHIEKALANFQGVKHRLQYVGETRGVRYYNDSKATNPVATSTALSGFDKNIILICGGQNRGIDFKELTPQLKKIKCMLLIGESKHILENLAKNNNVAYEICNKVSDATIRASELAEKEDIILLSPACASWDQYDNFEKRGDEFIESFLYVKNKE